MVRAQVALLQQNGHRVVQYGQDNATIAGFGLLRKASLLFTATWDQRSYRELRGLIRKERPELAHCHNLVPLISPAAYYACRAENVPVVQTLHNFRMWCPAGTMFHNGAACAQCCASPARAVLKACYRNSRTQTAAVAGMLACHRSAHTFEHMVDAYSVPSRFCLERAAEGGLPREKITVQPNFLLHDPGGRTGGRDYAIYVGRICREKGVREMLQAWRRLRGIPLLVVGDGPLRDAAESEAPEGVRFTGALSPEAAFAHMRAARFLVFPSIGYETFGLTVLEAAACGVATLGARTGAIPELVAETRTGLLFDPRDIDEFVDKVRWAWSHPLAMNEMGAVARREYLQRYTAGDAYHSLMTLYAKVLGRHDR